MGGRVCVGPRPLLCRGRIVGVRGDLPPPRGGGRNSLGHCSCSTSWAAQASPYPLGVCCACRAGPRLSCRCVQPTGVGGVCLRSRVVWSYEGVLLSEAGSPGVVAVDGRFRSPWCHASRRVLRREEVVPGPPRRLTTCGWPMWDSRRACAAVRRRCTVGDRLRWGGHARSASSGAGRSQRCCSGCS